MIINLKTYVIFCYLLLFNACFERQKNEFDTKRELVGYLDTKITEIENFIQLSNTKIELSPIHKNDFEIINEDSFLNLHRNKNINRNDLQIFFDSLPVSTKIQYPYNLIKIETDFERLKLLLNKDKYYYINNPYEKPSFYPISVTLLDQTIIDIENSVINKKSIANKYIITEIEDGEHYKYVETENAEPIEQFVWDESNPFKEYFAVKNPKVLKSIKFKVILPIIKSETKSFSHINDSFETKFGQIKLLGLSGNKIVMQYPSTLSENIELRGVYKDGRILKQKTKSNYTMLDSEGKKLFDELISTLEKAKLKVNNNEIKTEKELKNFIEKHSPKGLNDTQKYIIETIDFSGPVEQVDAIISSDNFDKEQFICTYNVLNKKYQENYFESKDFNTKNVGILNQNGKWLVSPKYDEHFRKVNQFYFRDQFEDEEWSKDDYYHFNPNTNEIKEVPYLVSGHTIYLNKYVIIKSKTSKLYGVADATTGEIITEIKYRYLYFDNVNNDFKLEN